MVGWVKTRCRHSLPVAVMNNSGGIKDTAPYQPSVKLATNSLLSNCLLIRSLLTMLEMIREGKSLPNRLQSWWVGEADQIKMIVVLEKRRQNDFAKSGCLSVIATGGPNLRGCCW